jgi:hypothetical protein
LQIIHEEDGKQFFSKIWSIRPSYQQDKISSIISAYLMHNDIELEILRNMLPEEMIESIKEIIDFES